jgi:hypothetical protein
MMFGNGTTKGASVVGFGEIQLINLDGGLDPLINYGFDGRSIVIKELIVATGIATVLFGCSMEQPVFTNDEISLRIKDPQIAFQVPLQTNKYAGSNTLPTGVEGTADIKGKPKPLAYGEVHNATPVLVNTSKLIYQGNDGALFSIPAVYDKGVALTLGTAYSTQAAMESAQPLPGTYDTWLAGGCFRLGSSAVGAVTCDMIQGAAAADRTAAQIGKQIALRATPTIAYDSADVTALDTLNSAVVGYYASAETTIAAAMDEVMGSIGAWYGFDSANVMNMGRLDAPSGPPAVTLTSAEIKDIQRLATQDEGRGLPVWKVNVNYDKNQTVQSADSLAGFVNYVKDVWTPGILPVSPTSWRGLAYGNGTYVAIGYNSIVLTSPDNVTWTQYTCPAGTWYGLRYLNGLFIAVGSNNCITSPDGQTWTTRTLPTGNYNGIGYGGGLFVAVGVNAAVMAISTSPDTITWTAQTTPVGIHACESHSYMNGTHVVVGEGGLVVTSPDAVTWTTQTFPSSTSLYDITAGNGLFVTLGSGSSAYTSPDGVTWTQRTLPGNYAWRRVVSGGGYFMAAASGTVSAISSDTTTWEQQTMPVAAYMYFVAYGNGEFVAILNSSSTTILTFPIVSKEVIYTSAQYRTVSDSDSSVQTANLLATEITLNTDIGSATDAATEATRQLNLRKVRRDYLSVTIKRSALTAIPALGKTVNITYPRYGYNGGKLFVLIGTDVNLQADDLILHLWG